ncbi:WD-40 repeat-containing protein MSI1-like [Pistacia vera]|uniref:WD-40 repeat-containing protein MSI1-like n=1 Tax=Pistacia vera TaxID=55513 RepID=UPI001263E329|nr:WD-40 repeat-containing protein MSI1-like [Pistacia vera]
MEKEQRIRDLHFEYWKRNRTFMHNKIINHFLEWPCHTVEWLPGKWKLSDRECYVHQLILGTHATRNEPNFLIVADVLFPEDESDLGGIGCRSGKVEVLRKILHKGVVKCARHMPQNTSYIATKTVSGEVHIFDHVKYPLEPAPDSVLTEQEGPELRLLGHRTNGYGFSHDKLSWSKLKKGYLLSGADDSQIFVWDINATPNNVALRSTRRFTGHNGAVQDVAWHMKNEHLFGSVGSDKCLSIWDLRQPGSPVQSVVAHQDEVTSLSFNPFDERTLATGSADKMVNLYDLRNVNKARYTFTDHRNVVNQVEWSPKNYNLLASVCNDRRLIIWDLRRIGTKQKFDQIFKGPPELLFVHIGHKSAIKEFSWDPNGDWDIASVAEDNDLQTWKITNDYDQGRLLSRSYRF